VCLLLGAVALIVAADTLFDYRLAHAAYLTGATTDVLWPLGYMTIALAAATLRRASAAARSPSEGQTPAASGADTGVERAAPTLRRALLPYLAVPLIGALAIYAHHDTADVQRDAGMYLGAGALVGVIVLRQILTMVENQRLYAQLDRAFTVQGQGLARRVAELEWLRDASRQVSTARTLLEVLDVTYDAVRALGFDRAGINLFNYDEGVFEDWIGTDACGAKVWSQSRVLQFSADSAIWRFPGIAAALRGEDLYYTEHAYVECPAELRYLYDGAPTHNVMVALRAGDTVVGNISVDNLVSGRPIAREEAGPLLALANQVGTAVERARALQALEQQALFDSLTGLPNRTMLFTRLRQALRATHQSALALLLIDLNRFKEVNDTLGHYVGDVLLQRVGDRLRDALRVDDTVARLGGDEFAVLLPAATAADAIAVADKVLAALDAPFALDEQQLEIGASIGIALSPDHGRDPTTLLRHADVAMYVAKRAGGGYVVYDAEQDSNSLDRLSLIGDLRQALSQDQLTIHYQPLIDARRACIYGVEALLRWTHPERGPIPPDQFIALAEQCGLIVPLTYWTLEQATRQSARWRRAGLDLSMSVNLSMRTLHDRRLPDLLEGLLCRYGVPPEQLTLEITESALIGDPAQVLTVLSRLDTLGVRFSVDDFGTGYSSLAYLRQLPVDEIKIDRSFIVDIDAAGKDIALVRSMLAMAHELDLSVVVEGVETLQAFELLRAQRDVRVQGYYFSRALPADQLVAWVAGSAWGRAHPD
jgi:diguanylate cyclase (GGDEF)-like protein